MQEGLSTAEIDRRHAEGGGTGRRQPRRSCEGTFLVVLPRDFCRHLRKEWENDEMSYANGDVSVSLLLYSMGCVVNFSGYSLIVLASHRVKKWLSKWHGQSTRSRGRKVA